MVEVPVDPYRAVRSFDWGNKADQRTDDFSQAQGSGSLFALPGPFLFSSPEGNACGRFALPSCGDITKPSRLDADGGGSGTR